MRAGGAPTTVLEDLDGERREVTAHAQLGELEAQRPAGVGAAQEHHGGRHHPALRREASGSDDRLAEHLAALDDRPPGRRCGPRRRRRARRRACTSSSSTRCVASPQVGKRLAVTLARRRQRGRRRAPRPAPGPWSKRPWPQQRLEIGAGRSSTIEHDRLAVWPTRRSRALRLHHLRARRLCLAGPGCEQGRSRCRRAGNTAAEARPSRFQTQRQSSESATTASPHQARARYG